MKQGTLFYDRESGRYNFHYTDEDGDRRDYGGIHCGEVFEFRLSSWLKCMSLSTVVLYRPTGISTSPMEMEPLCATAMVIPSFFLGLVSVIWAFSFRSC